MDYTIGYSTEEFSEEDAKRIIEEMHAIREILYKLGVDVFDDGRFEQES